MDYLLAFAAGVLVGALYALIKVRSPAPPIAALFGLSGMWVAYTVLTALS